MRRKIKKPKSPKKALQQAVSPSLLAHFLTQTAEEGGEDYLLQVLQFSAWLRVLESLERTLTAFGKEVKLSIDASHAVFRFTYDEDATDFARAMTTGRSDICHAIRTPEDVVSPLKLEDITLQDRSVRFAVKKLNKEGIQQYFQTLADGEIQIMAAREMTARFRPGGETQEDDTRPASDPWGLGGDDPSFEP